MNQILLFENDFIGENRVKLSDRRLAHVLEYYDVQPGQALKVGLVNGLMGKGNITHLDSSSIEMEISLTDPPPPPLDCTLILAMPRPRALKRIIQHATAMGVKKLYIIKTWKVEKGFWTNPILGEEQLLEQMVLGLEQAKDTMLPKIEIRTLFKPFVEDELPGIIKGTSAITAHPAAEKILPSVIHAPVTLAIGPDGGFIPYEIEKLASAGFSTFHMGPRILRVETAVPVILGRISPVL